MSSEAAHLAMAQRNQAVIEHLLQRPDDCAEWIATVAFYKALHLVEAVFARDPEIGHGRNHETREYYLKSRTRYSHIFKHYRPLWAASVVARYLQDAQGTTYSSFGDYLSAADVQAKLLNHRLRQIEKSTAKLLSKR